MSNAGAATAGSSSSGGSAASGAAGTSSSGGGGVPASGGTVASGGASGGQAGTGNETGGAGGLAGSGGTATGPVTPVMRDGQWALDAGDVTLEVDPMKGGRVTMFKLATGDNLLTDATVNPTYWGSTLWTSPESQWAQPPPTPIDSDPYTVTATDTSVTMTGMPYAMLGVSVTKTFSADARLGAFHLEYKLTNTKQAAIQMAPWEVTRVYPKGLTFFPTGATPTLSPGATLPTTDVGGVTWFNYDMNAVTADSKLYADAAEGWSAHAVDGAVFIKSLGDLMAAQIAPEEGDVELYTNKLHTYIEMEDQGAYGMIAPAASVSWTVTWFLKKLPQGVDGTVPNDALAKFVRDVIAAK